MKNEQAIKALEALRDAYESIGCIANADACGIAIASLRADAPAKPEQVVTAWVTRDGGAPLGYVEIHKGCTRPVIEDESWLPNAAMREILAPLFGNDYGAKAIRKIEIRVVEDE